MALKIATLDVNSIIGSRCRFGQQRDTPTKARSRAMQPASGHPVEARGLSSGRARAAEC